jgi:hypothetical protein
MKVFLEFDKSVLNPKRPYYIPILTYNWDCTMSTSSKANSSQPDPNDYLFWIPTEEIYPKISKRDAWTEKQALKYVVEELICPRDTSVVKVLMNQFDDVSYIEWMSIEGIREIKVRVIDPDTGKESGDEPLSEFVIDKIEKFKIVYQYLSWYKSFTLTPVLWQFVITKKRYKRFLSAYNQKQIVPMEEKVTFFHPGYKKYVTYEPFQEEGYAARRKVMELICHLESSKVS